MATRKVRLKKYFQTTLLLLWVIFGAIFITNEETVVVSRSSTLSLKKQEANSIELQDNIDNTSEPKDDYFVVAEGSDVESDQIRNSENVVATETKIQEVSIHQLEDSKYLQTDIRKPSVVQLDKSSKELNHTAPDNPYVDKEVMGFAPYWSFSNWYQNYQYDKLSIVAYFSLNTYGDGSWVTTDTPWSVWQSSEMDNMIDNAHANDVKVVPVVKNFTAHQIYSIVSNKDGAADKLINNTLIQIRNRDLDGVNIDFEFISNSSDTRCDGPCTADRVRPHMTNFVDRMANAVHNEVPNSHVSVDVYGGSAIWSTAFDIEDLGKTSVDAIMVMSYDFYRTNSSMAAPTSPLYGDQYYYTVSESMVDMVSKAPKHKIIMGVPYYGLEFPTSNDQYNSPTRGSGGIAYYYRIVDSSEDTWHNSNTIRWNDTDKSRWYAYRYPDPSTSSWWQGYYDDPTSLNAKYDFVHSVGLQGIGIWALGYDNGRDELWNEIRNNFSKNEFLVLFKNWVSVDRQNQIISNNGGQVVRRLSNDSNVIVKPNSITSYELITRLESKSEVKAASFVEDRELN